MPAIQAATTMYQYFFKELADMFDIERFFPFNSHP